MICMIIISILELRKQDSERCCNLLGVTQPGEAGEDLSPSLVCIHPDWGSRGGGGGEGKVCRGMGL